MRYVWRGVDLSLLMLRSLRAHTGWRGEAQTPA
jgi:hypothetical protein